MAFAAPLLMAAVAGAPASAQGMADDSACLEEFLLGEAFGLCNAYCEAMDCDGTPQASAKACEKVHAKFMAVADMEPPCLGDEPTNDPPEVDLSGDPNDGSFDTTATFVSFGDPVPIAVHVEITDSDEEDLIESASIMLTDQPVGASGFLTLTEAGMVLLADLCGGVAEGCLEGDGTSSIIITAVGTREEYAALLEEIVYDNDDGSPLTDPDRSIKVLVSDGFENSNTATSVMAVTVGCPCTAFTSDIIIDTGLMTYETVRNARDGCGSSGNNCYNSRFAFNLPQVESCTKVLEDSIGTFEYQANINVFVLPPSFDQRTFRVTVGGDTCSLTMSGRRGVDTSLRSFQQFRSTFVGVKPFEFVDSWTSEMTDACVAALPRLKGLLIDFWEGADGIAKLPRCTF